MISSLEIITELAQDWLVKASYQHLCESVNILFVMASLLVVVSDEADSRFLEIF